MKFDSAVTGAKFDEKEHKWTVQSTSGTVKARWFIPCIGFAAKAYTPDWKGIDKFKGTIAHTAVSTQMGPVGGILLTQDRPGPRKVSTSRARR